ncbi:MAG: hypothetical protein HY437_00715 [Candidatus Magasanikbacteria bacterium]|nr:hypothetical protein [Candidatus Magasanikbacteria bacterium]
MDDDRRFDARVNSPREIIEELLPAIDSDTEFSSNLAEIQRHQNFTAIVELYRLGNAGHEPAIRALVEQLEHHPWSAALLLHALIEERPKIAPEYTGNLHRVVEAWITWAHRRHYTTERSHRFLAWVRIHRKVTERFMRILAGWRYCEDTEHRACGQRWNALVRIGKQYPSVVYPIVITEWALPRLSDEKGHALMAAISGVDDPTENLLDAPHGVEPHHFDPNNYFSSWYEWFRRWSPVVAPYQLWSKP